MMERDIEHAFKVAVEAKGGLCLKLGVTYQNGMPDRLVLMPNGICAFVELKQKGKKPRAIQRWQHERLRKLGYKVFVLDRTSDIENVINQILDSDVTGKPTAQLPESVC